MGKKDQVSAFGGGRYTVPGMRNKKDTKFFAEQGHGSMHCCGLRELDFQVLAKTEIHSDPKFKEAVAKYLKAMVSEEDGRVIIVGIPTRVGANSQYNLEFYNALREVLHGFGMKQAGTIYKNSNSSNHIAALIGQMPE